LPVSFASIVVFSACSGFVSSKASPDTGELPFVAEERKDGKEQQLRLTQAKFS